MGVPPPGRKVLPPGRLVRDIESYLDPINYDEYNFPAEEKISSSYLERPKNRHDCGVKIHWSNQPPSGRGRQTSSNMISGRIEVRRGQAAKATTAREAWELFFTNEMMSLIVAKTNAKVVKLKGRLSEEFLSDSRNSYVRETSKEEIAALIGLIYIRGLFCWNNHRARIVLNDKTGHPIFGATMSVNRFAFLTSNICFDDEESRPERWQADRFAAFREFFEKFHSNCGRHVIPDDFLSLDETLYPMRTQIGFKQLNPSKPAKYGMLFKSVNAARYPYTFITSVYSGKPEGNPCQYYVTGSDGIVMHLVSRLQRLVDLRGRIETSPTIAFIHRSLKPSGCCSMV